MYSTIILHANLQYAEIPPSEISNIVNQSYLPVITTLLEIPTIKAALNFTGVTLEILRDEYPLVLDLLKKGINQGKFELTGCGYSHPIFPLLPIQDMKKQVEYNQKVLLDTLDYKPKGFWLPELAYDPLLPKVLKNFDFSYIFIDEELYQISKTNLNDSNPYNPQNYTASQDLVNFTQAKSLFRKIYLFYQTRKRLIEACKRADFSPVKLRGVNGTITGIKVSQAWSIFSGACLLKFPFIHPEQITKMITEQGDSEGLVIPYGSDMEFFGYRSFIEGRLATAKDLKKLVEKIMDVRDLEMVLPSEYLGENRPCELGYMKAGSWSPDRRLDLWTRDEDNKRLERLCEEARWYFAHLPESEVTDELWKHLLLAENSDGRGWNPIPERRLECLRNAYEAVEKSRKKYQKFCLENTG